MLVLLGLVLPVLHLELAQLGGQVHEGDRDHLRLPLEAQGGAETVVHEGPGHLTAGHQDEDERGASVTWTIFWSLGLSPLRHLAYLSRAE